jgi:hypothetical protein
MQRHFHHGLLAMTDDPRTPLDARLYRTGLRLCPGEFRQDHAGEMACDFEDARREAAAAGTKGLWMFRLLFGADLARTLLVQWMRTGLPAIGVVAVLVPLLLANAVATASRFLTTRVRIEQLPSDAVGVILLSSVAVMVIVATIVFNHWVHRPRRIGRR